MREGLKFMAKRKVNTKETLQEQAEMILQLAEKKGVSTKYFFKTTFQRYQMQMEILGKLEEAIKENGPTVEKEYVKGRKNLVVNPAITEYNKTSTACNGTLSTLLNVLKSLDSEETEEGGKLQSLLNAF